jgi:hypothetical protein
MRADMPLLEIQLEWGNSKNGYAITRRSTLGAEDVRGCTSIGQHTNRPKDFLHSGKVMNAIVEKLEILCAVETGSHRRGAIIAPFPKVMEALHEKKQNSGRKTGDKRRELLTG